MYTKVPFQKVPLSYSDQLALLKSRGLLVHNDKKACSYLKRIGYYRLQAYALNFQSDRTTHQYREDVYFEQIIGLYNFDRSLRAVIIDAVESFEITFRTAFTNYLTTKYDSAFPHLNKTLFTDKKDLYKKSIELLAKEFDRSEETFIQHFKEKYVEELPPLWMSSELMTFGSLSKWYQNLKRIRDKEQIANVFGMNARCFISCLSTLTNIRNYSAHYARVWNRQLKSSLNQEIQQIEVLKNQLSYNSEDFLKIYNPLVVLIYCLKQINSPVKLSEKVKNLIDKYQINTKSMGFPPNWRQFEYWS